MIAYAFNNCAGARVPHREALAGEAAEEGPSIGCAVKHRVASNHVLLGGEVDQIERRDREDSSGEALAGVVVCVAAQRDRDSRGEPASETLPGRAFERDLDSPLRQSFGSSNLSDAAREQTTDAAVDVADRALNCDLLAALDRRLGKFDQLPIDRAFEHLRWRADTV